MRENNELIIDVTNMVFNEVKVNNDLGISVKDSKSSPL